MVRLPFVVAALALLGARVLAAPEGSAEAPSPHEGLTARSAAAEAIRANPEIAAASAAIESARGRLVQAGLWSNPELRLDVRTDAVFRNEGERGFGFDFEQRFPVAGRIDRAKDVARVDVAIALAELREFERTLVGDVQRSVFSLAALDEAIESRDHVIETAAQLVRAATRRRAAAEVSDADVNLLEIELARFAQERRRLELERQTEAIELNRLLNRAVDTPVEVSVALAAPAVDLSEARAEAVPQRPDVVRIQLGVDRARSEAALARAETWEDWAFGIGFENERQVFEGEPASDPIGVKRDDFLSVALSVPLPLWNRNQGRADSARADERAVKARLSAVLRAAQAEIATARRRVEELARVAREYDERLLPLAHESVALLERGYRQGLVPITTLVQAEQQLADTVLRRAETLGELRQAEVDLETAAGSSPLLRGSEENQEIRP